MGGRGRVKAKMNAYGSILAESLTHEMRLGATSDEKKVIIVAGENFGTLFQCAHAQLEPFNWVKLSWITDNYVLEC